MGQVLHGSARTTEAGVWDRLMDAVTDAHGGDVRMIDGASVRVHHSAATLKKATRIDALDAAGAEQPKVPAMRSIVGKAAEGVLLRKSML